MVSRYSLNFFRIAIRSDDPVISKSRIIVSPTARAETPTIGSHHREVFC